MIRLHQGVSMLHPEYAGPGTVTPKRWQYQAALWCGLIPLVAGVGALVLYAFSREPAFVVMGLAVVPFGLAALLFGFTFLVRYKRDAHQAQLAREPVLKRQMWIATAVLLANIPAAAVCAVAGIALVLAVHVDVTVQNLSSVPVEVELNTPAGVRRISHLSPGATATRSFTTWDGGSLSYVVVQSGRTLEGTIVQGDEDTFRGGTFNVQVKDGAVDSD
jgi:hypothetical protein